MSGPVLVTGAAGFVGQHLLRAARRPTARSWAGIAPAPATRTSTA